MAAAPKKRSEDGASGLARLEQRIGHEFSDPRLLERALTHASLRPQGNEEFHYERLEFLGDRILGLAIADMLYRNFPDANEGELSVRYNMLVQGKTLAKISDSLDLHEFIRTSSDIRELTGKRMQSVRADVLEAVIASIYLDGGMEAAMRFIDSFWSGRLHDPAAARRDSKTELQEWAHAGRLGTPEYTEVSRSGPDHEPVFVVTVRLDGRPESTGEGRSKRAAEHAAAEAMLEREGVRQAKDSDR